MTSSKCFTCSKKLTLVKAIQNRCKCGQCFCHHHKFPEQHQCTYDYTIHHQQQLKQRLPRIQAQKVKSI